MEYPFECIVCGVMVLKTRNKYRNNTKAHKLGKCRNKCDGIARDYGGYPIDPILKQKYKEIKKQRFEEKKEARDKKTVPIRLLKENNFYDSREWKELRYQAIKKYGRKCMACFAIDVPIHVDHIKPRSKFPELELDFDNLQILCSDCNLGKSNKDETDFREKNKPIFYKVEEKYGLYLPDF